MTVRRLKVCFMIPGFSDGGAQKQCIYLLNALQESSDVDLSLIRFHDGPHDHLLRTDRLAIHETRVRSNFDPRAALFALRTIHRIKPDILITWMHSCDVYGALVRRLSPGLRWIMTERDSRYPDEAKYRLRRTLGRHAEAIVANSSSGERYWIDAGARGQRFVVDNIVHAPAPSRRDPGENVIYIGRLEPQKNVLVLARAYCLVAQRRPDLHFQLVGKGALAAEIADIIAEAGVGDRVSLLGFRSDIPQLLTQSRLSVLLSHHEGLPNVLLESVAQGVPLVASDIPEHRDLLGPDFPYYVASREDPVAAAAVIERALDEAAASDGLDFARARLAQMKPAAVASSYLSIFRKVMEKAS
jgi:glycosyltransferase involved in cell wall biosynthesis